MADLLLGIDIGTTAVKAALFTPVGRVEAVHDVSYPTQYLRHGWVEQHPEDWWDAVCVAVRAVVNTAPDAAARIAGLAVSAQAPALVALDHEGRVLRPALIWMDRRAEAQAEQLSEEFGFDRIFQLSGNRPDPYYVAAKVRWLRDNEPEILARTYKFVQVNGYVNFRLTGQHGIDPTQASLTQLWERTSDEWSADLCDACGVDVSQLPAISAAHEIMGEVTAEAAQATGLRVGTPVMTGQVDGSAAALEAGAAEEGTAAEMTGTSTVLMIPNASGLTDPDLIYMPHSVPGTHLLLGAMVASGASLRWYRDQFGQIEQQASAMLDADVFDLLTQQAASAPPGSEGVIFLPYMMGERSPLWHTEARGVLFGLSLATSRGAVIRAILEGTGFAMRHNIEVARAAGAHIDVLRAVGGGTRSPLWNQIKADILGIPIAVTEAPIGAPFGDAMLVGMGLGLLPDLRDTLRQIVQVKTVYEPNCENEALYQSLYGIFRNLYTHLRQDFDDAASVLAGY